MNQETAIIKVYAGEYKDLPANKAAEVEAVFLPMIQKMKELTDEYEQIKTMPRNKVTCGLARDLRLQFKKVRTGTADIHKKVKAEYLAGGRFVDGWKNAQAYASQGIEEELEKIEKHFENLEKERVEKLNKERCAELQKYGFNSAAANYGAMEDSIWGNFLNGVKYEYEKKQAAAEQAKKDAEAARETKAAEEAKTKADQQPAAGGVPVQGSLLSVSRDQGGQQAVKTAPAQPQKSEEREKLERFIADLQAVQVPELKSPYGATKMLSFRRRLFDLIVEMKKDVNKL